ncbi:MAG TPA: hypothetical protein VMY99_05150 [Nevskiaceae bacterium]|nr:hypothetical protein [Nevskiaceae bacterium]
MQKPSMRVVTSGSTYIDIDGYAGIVAYAELLQTQGVTAIAATSAVPNQSVPTVVQAWQAPLQTDYTSGPDDTFTIIDISDIDFFDKMVVPDRVDEVIDHHLGHEAYWRAHLGKKAQIEFVGAACTLIFERWEAAGLLTKMSQVSARLLVCGILDNTLNFKARVTATRDRHAYKQLLPVASLPQDWPAQYFSACQQTILANVVNAIRDDAKILTFAGQTAPFGVGQIVIWDARQVMPQVQTAAQEIMPHKQSPWFINVVSISEGKSYFVCTDQKLQDWLANLLGVTFKNNIARATRLWLRKEIMKQSMK